MDRETFKPPVWANDSLRVYLLGEISFDTALELQRHLVSEIAVGGGSPALVLCQHPPLITVGREGSLRHILCEPEEMRARRWGVRWVNRGGGCVLHLPGQLAIYPILPLKEMGWGLTDLTSALRDLTSVVVRSFSINQAVRTEHAGVRVGNRLIGVTAAAVRDWVSYFGVYLNVNPDLAAYRSVSVGGDGEPPMTSLARERRGPVHAAVVRRQVVEASVQCFGFAQYSIFTDHALLQRRTRRLLFAPV